MKHAWMLIALARVLSEVLLEIFPYNTSPVIINTIIRRLLKQHFQTNSPGCHD